MGCVNSRADINDLHPNIFQVMNVDDLGNLITPGRLEITDWEIVLYQRGKQPVKWPLRCLRRYGYDSEIFSFESGRRCSTGPGIYAFKCRKADQLFNLVQSNIQVCNSNGDDSFSRDLSMTAHTVAAINRMTIPPVETNYLDPMPVRSNTRVTPRFSHSQQNGISRLSSAGSSSGPMSPQGTMGSPSPPPIAAMPLAGASGIPPAPMPPQPMSQSAHHHHPSAVYVNDQVLSALAMEIELDNNNKSLRRTMQRSHTLSSSTSSSGFLPEQATTGLTMIGQETKKPVPTNRPPPLSMPAAATYINIDISTEQSPLSPAHCISNSGHLAKRDETGELDQDRHAYMNICTETGLETMLERMRPSVLPQPLPQPHQPIIAIKGGGESAGGGGDIGNDDEDDDHHNNDGCGGGGGGVGGGADNGVGGGGGDDDGSGSGNGGNKGESEESRTHCYANLEPAEIEGLRVRWSIATRADKSPSLLPPPVPPLPPPLPLSPLLISPPPSSILLPVTVASPPSSSSTPSALSEPVREVNYAILDLDKKNVWSEMSVMSSLEHTGNAIPSPPDSPSKMQKGYATIDFNKTAALSHSVNPNLVNDNEGSRKTRHNSTINDLMTSAPRHSSSISE